MIRILLLSFCAGLLQAQVPPEYRGDWILVNGVLVLQVDENSITLRNTGVEAPVEVAEDGTFVWQTPPQAETGKFENGKLYLQGAPGAPAWMAFVEFRRADADMAAEVIEFALRQQNQAMASFEKIRRTSQEKAVLNNLRQLASAADQYYLEHGVRTATYEDLVGPDKYVRRISVVDGEDYSTLSFELGKPLSITTDSGIEVTY